jgi:hypothetical protein
MKKIRLHLFFFLALIATNAASAAGRAEIADKDDQTIALWKSRIINEVFTDDGSIFVDITTKNGTRKLWNPLSNELKSISKDSSIKMNGIGTLPPNTTVPLTGDSSVRLSVNEVSAKCGLTIGTSFTLSTGDGSSGSFYLISKYIPPKKTSYCGQQLTQTYDATSIVTVAAMADHRIALVNFSKNQVIILDRAPSKIISLGGESFLVPVDLLKAGFESASDNQRLRYQTLVRILKNNHVKLIEPKTIQ